MTQAVPSENAAKAIMEIQHDRLLKPSDIFGLGALGSTSSRYETLGSRMARIQITVTTASRTTTNQKTL